MFVFNDGYVWRATQRNVCATEAAPEIIASFVTWKSFYDVFKILVGCYSDEQQHSIFKKEFITNKTSKKISQTKKVFIIKAGNKRKIGGPGVIVQIDETTMNFRAKSCGSGVSQQYRCFMHRRAQE